MEELIVNNNRLQWEGGTGGSLLIILLEKISIDEPEQLLSLLKLDQESEFTAKTLKYFPMTVTKSDLNTVGAFSQLFSKCKCFIQKAMFVNFLGM